MQKLRNAWKIHKNPFFRRWKLKVVSPGLISEKYDWRKLWKKVITKGALLSSHETGVGPFQYTFFTVRRCEKFYQKKMFLLEGKFSRQNVLIKKNYLPIVAIFWQTKHPLVSEMKQDLHFKCWQRSSVTILSSCVLDCFLQIWHTHKCVRSIEQGRTVIRIELDDTNVLIYCQSGISIKCIRVCTQQMTFQCGIDIFWLYYKLIKRRNKTLKI